MPTCAASCKRCCDAETSASRSLRHRGRLSRAARHLRPARGNPQYKGDKVEPAFPRCSAALSRSSRAAAKGRRRAAAGASLADWIASPKNPLTARVMVNRVWQYHFGRGIVRFAEQFRLHGDRPTHPELLDWLASEFVRHGWSMKRCTG